MDIDLHSSEISYAVRAGHREPAVIGSGPAAFVIRARSVEDWQRILHLDAYRASMAFVNGEFDVDHSTWIVLEIERSGRIGMAREHPAPHVDDI